MNRREKILAFGVGGLVLALGANSFAVEPALAWYKAARDETAGYEQKIQEAQALVDRENAITAAWNARHKAGLLSDENTARFAAQQTLASAAETSGFQVESVGGGQRMPAVHGQAYDQLRLTLSGHGTLAQVQGFLAGCQQAALPWRVDRCELAARDGRKDRLDASLTLSLRIASEEARKKIAVPKKAAAWAPAARDGALDAAVLKAKPFLADRRAPETPRAVVARTEDPTPPPPPPPPGSDWTLAGLVTKDGVGEALVVHAGDQEPRLLHAGDAIAGGKVERVDADGLCMAYGDDKRVIQPGHTLSGAAASSAAAPSSFVSSGTFGGKPKNGGSRGDSRAGRGSRGPQDAALEPAPVAAPAPALGDADREAILKRLRDQRNRTSP